MSPESYQSALEDIRGEIEAGHCCVSDALALDSPELRCLLDSEFGSLLPLRKPTQTQDDYLSVLHTGDRNKNSKVARSLSSKQSDSSSRHHTITRSPSVREGSAIKSENSAQVLSLKDLLRDETRNRNLVDLALEEAL